ncbi:hypothetical protein RND81_11G008800 [Saponaria officinalis]|uniref:AAA+ ATPase domain-containing protein n=1 Tax=Saponaria officinalis TaxID=3572 RepID=A0AAW1HG20_SAPOF
MGRRGSGGGSQPRRRQSTLSPAIIQRRIELCKINHLSDDDIAEHLYSAYYPDYKHFKLIPFRNKLKQILNAAEYGGTPPRNKRRKTEESDTETPSSVASMAEDETEDAVPEFDIMKSLVRTQYGENPSKSKSKPKDDRHGGGVAAAGSEAVEEAAGGELKGKEKGGIIRFRDFGGIKKVIDELLMEVIVPLYNPQLPLWLGVKPMSGILLHGPPGCGKTRLAQAIANETGVPFYQISATEIVSGVSGTSEENIRELFSKAYQTAPSIVFIDEIDAIASKRENLQREMERRIVTQLLTCMDESHMAVKSSDANSDTEDGDKKSGYVLVIGATNRPDAVDAALRRPGRFD